MSAFVNPRPVWFALRSRVSTWLVLAAIAIWAGFLAIGFGWLFWHESLAGVESSKPLPAKAMRVSVPGPALVMFAHPHCPCTHSSLQQLELLLARAPELQTVQVVFLQSKTPDYSWSHSLLVQQAEHISRVQIDWQSEANLIAEYGSLASGHVMLFHQDGRLLFSGGLTDSRGHEGTSAGTAAILSHLRGEPGAARTPVYGCSLVTPSLQP